MHHIADDLQALATPVDTLTLLPGNPRRGDIEAVARSLARFGQRKPITVKADGTVTAGNHTLQAARSLGWSHIAVVVTDDDEATAKAWALADNRTADLGTYDDQLLADLIGEIQAAGDVELFAATGWDDTSLSDLLAQITKSCDFEGDAPPTLDAVEYRILVTCKDESHQRSVLESLESEGLECRLLMT
jgi:hypothetical protein